MILIITLECHPWSRSQHSRLREVKSNSYSPSSSSAVAFADLDCCCLLGSIFVPTAVTAAAGAIALLLPPAVAVAAAVTPAVLCIVADNDACQSAIACFSSTSSRSCASYVDRVQRTSNSVCREVHWCANAKYRTAV
jgi:hypothetical protein